MASYIKFQPFVYNLATQLVNLNGTPTVALSNTDPTATASTLSQVSQISYTNLSTRVLSNLTATQTAGTFTLDADDLTMTASGAVGPFQYVILYDDNSASDYLIGYYDYASAVSMVSGDTFKLTFNASGILDIA